MYCIVGKVNCDAGDCVCEDGEAPVDSSCHRNPCDWASCQFCETCLDLGNGDARCIKKAGYLHSTDQCQDVDECSTGYDKCDEHSDCINLEGNYYCSCHEGYSKINGVCTDIDECSVEAPCDQICTNSPGSFACSCRGGYRSGSDTRSNYYITYAIGYVSNMYRIHLKQRRIWLRGY